MLIEDNALLANLTASLLPVIVSNITTIFQATSLEATALSNDTNKEPTISNQTISTETDVDRSSFISGFTQSFLLIFLAEIGDRTFIVVMLLANKMNKFALWLIATIALNIMNAISVSIGAIFAVYIPKTVVSIIVIALFFAFGIKLLYSGIYHKNDEGEDELGEAKETLEKLDALNEKREALLPEGHHQAQVAPRSSWKFWERSQYTFLMFLIMCTEWGDVSQVVAIGLAAKYGMMSIIIGGGLGHAACVTLGILLGALINKFCTEKIMNIMSGCLFTIFGLRELFNLFSGTA